MNRLKKINKKYKRKSDVRINKVKVLILILIFIFVFLFSRIIIRKGKADFDIDNVTAFRISFENLLRLKELSKKYELEFSEMVVYYAFENNFFENKLEADDKIEQEFIMKYDSIKNKYRFFNFDDYYNLFNNIYQEIDCFPVLVKEGEKVKYCYSDNWGAERTYGGNRLHMGTDIMDKENICGRLPVVSMTNGTVSNIGWNEKGGWRVGITSLSGNYYYYAHLDSFAEGLEKGTEVSSGTLIGYMGNTGYSKTEGTKGNFEVHLHVGISPKSKLFSGETWINPYPFLRMAEEKLSD